MSIVIILHNLYVVIMIISIIIYVIIYVVVIIIIMFIRIIMIPYIYIYIYTHMSVSIYLSLSLYIYIYVYIYRERERERDIKLWAPQWSALRPRPVLKSHGPVRADSNCPGWNVKGILDPSLLLDRTFNTYWAYVSRMLLTLIEYVMVSGF